MRNEVFFNTVFLAFLKIPRTVGCFGHIRKYLGKRLSVFVNTAWNRHPLQQIVMVML